MRPLAVKAGGGGIPTAVECPAREKASQASGGGTLEMGDSIPDIVGSLLFLSACEARDDG